MQLTATQRRVVDHDAGRMRVRGAAGTGKTSALVARYIRLTENIDASRLLVVCRDRAAAIAFRDAVLPDLTGGFDALPITTIHGVAYDLVARHQGSVRLLVGAEQRALVRELIDGEGEAEWPTLHPLLGRNAFVDEVSEAVLAYQGALAHGAVIDDPRWRELAAFADRYLDVLDGRGCTDAAGLLVRALASPAPDRFHHLLVDDHDPTRPVAVRLIEHIAADAQSLCAAGTHVDDADIELTTTFRHLVGPPELVRCAHPAVEPEAIAGELLTAHRGGVPWAQMAVLVRRSSPRARAIAATLARHAIPVTPVPGVGIDEPVVRAVIDMLRWVNGDPQALERLLASPIAGLDAAAARELRRREAELEAQPEVAALVQLRDDLASRAGVDNPATLANTIWRRALTHLAADDGTGHPGDDRALDALVAFLEGLRRHTERNPGDRLPQYLALLGGAELEPDPWRIAVSTEPAAVTITSIATSAGREWDTVVVAACVEGELPNIRGRAAFFDVARLDGIDPPSVAERRRRSLAEERRLFEEVACTRATRRLVGTAAPEAGVLLSRFVESWPSRPPELPLAPGPRARRARTDRQRGAALSRRPPSPFG